MLMGWGGGGWGGAGGDGRVGGACCRPGPACLPESLASPVGQRHFLCIAIFNHIRHMCYPFDLGCFFRCDPIDILFYSVRPSPESSGCVSPYLIASAICDICVIYLACYAFVWDPIEILFFSIHPSRKKPGRSAPVVVRCRIYQHPQFVLSS